MKRVIPTAFLLWVLVASPSFAQVETKNPPRPVPTSTPGQRDSPQLRTQSTGTIVVGEMAPDFELDGSHAKPVRLASFRGRWLLVAFGDRKEDVGPLRSVTADLNRSDVQVIGVCGEKAYNLVAFAKREAIPFLMLADITREISEMYGLYDWQERKVLPGYVLINPAGEVRLALLGVSFPPGDVARLVQYVTARL